MDKIGGAASPARFTQNVDALFRRFWPELLSGWHIPSKSSVLVRDSAYMIDGRTTDDSRPSPAPLSLVSGASSALLPEVGLLSVLISFRKGLNELGSLPEAGRFSDNEPGSGDSGSGDSGSGDSGNGDSGNGDSGNCDSGNGESGSGKFSKGELVDNRSELSKFNGKGSAFETIRKSRKSTKFITESKIMN